ncbi:hypothetical protein [Streptomyces sp. NPDC002324]
MPLQELFGKRSKAAAVVGATTIAFVVAGPAPAAYAGPECGNLGCSSTVNDSGVGAVAYFNWCRSWDLTGASTTTQPTCSSGGAAQKTEWLSPGEHTPWDQDWDAFRVDAGWCYKVSFDIPGPINDDETYDRRGKSALYVKVGDEANAHIVRQSSSSC